MLPPLLTLFTLSSRNEMRRFITLVDALYEGHVSLVLLAEAQVLHD